MRLVTYHSADGQRLGVLSENGLIDVNEAARSTSVALPSDMREFISLGDRGLDILEAILPTATLVPAEGLRLAPPIAEPRRNVFAVGRNYLEHIREGSRARGETAVDLPKVAAFFSKPPSAFIGQDDEIELHPSITSNLDYEVELVVVIGNPGRDIAAEDGLDHVYGYTVGNDVSARDLQRAHGQWFKGKALDRTSPVGPWIVPARYLPDIHDAQITLRVNGERRQDSRTSQMIYDVATIIHQLSQGLTLETADLIMTGTPSGVGHGMTPPQWLAEGDVVEAEIEGIGMLRNRVGVFGTRKAAV